MASVSGLTTTDALADSMPTVIAAARQVREYVGAMPTVVDRVNLGQGVGSTWNEISMEKLTAQAVTQNTVLDNAQKLVDTLFAVTPTRIGIKTIITDEVAGKLDKKAFARTGTLAMNAIQRKKDQDGLTALDGATTSLGGAGTTITSGHITAAVSRIEGNSNEPGMPPFFWVDHPFKIKDIWDEIIQGVNATTAPEQLLQGGLSERVYTSGYRKGELAGASVIPDGNASIDGADDTKGGVFAREALVLVQGLALKTETRRRPDVGGGATEVFIYDDYAYGERSSGNWLFEIYGDATAASS